MGRRINNMKLRRVLAYLLTAVMVVALVPGGSSKVKAAESIWQNQDIVHWTNGYPMHEVSEHNWEYHTPIYNDNHISFFELDHEEYPDTYDNYHGALATCSTCHATATTLDTYTHTYSKSTTTCDDCGYHPQYYVTIKYTLADGVTAPTGFVEEEKKGPYDRGATYTAYAKSYEGLRATRTSGYSSDTIHHDCTVEYEYSYSDPCSKGANHERKYVSVSDTEHKYCCTKCDTVWATSEHDKNGVSNRSLTTCQFACSDCGFKKTFVQHNYETYNITDKDGGKKVMKVCKNCGFETTDCEHEWETEEYQEEGGDHVRVCKLCKFEDRHTIDANGSWMFVREADCCRLPCCRRCKQATWQAEIGDPSELCHEIACEQNGSHNTHRAYCKKCGYVFDENAPCFQDTEWLAQLSDDITEEEMAFVSSKVLTVNADGTATRTCACGNIAHIDKNGRYIDGPYKGELADVTSNTNVEDESGILNETKNPKCDLEVMVSRFLEDVKKVAEDKMKNELLDHEDDFWSYNDVKDAAQKNGISEEELKNRLYEFGGFVSDMKVLNETEKTNEDGSVTKTLEYDISMKYKYNISVGDTLFEVSSKALTVDEPTRIEVTTPNGFGNDGDTVRIDHYHDGSHYTYYGKVNVYNDTDGQHTTVSWTSERGLSPFILTISDSINDEYADYVKNKRQNRNAVKTEPSVTAPKAKSGLVENGKNQELVTKGEVIGGLMKYALTTENKEPGSFLYSTSIPVASKKGVYYVWYKVSGDSSHNDLKPTMLTVNIADPNQNTNDDKTVGGEQGTEKNDAPAAKVVGDTVTDASSKAIYVVTSTNPKTVEYKATTVTGKKVKIPDVVVVNGETFKVTSIADGAFKGNKKVTSVSVGANVTSIGDEVFSGCANLTSVTVPKTITKLGKNVFKGCKKLKTITIKTTKLTAKNVSKNAFKGITNKTVIKVPKKKLKDYKKLFRKKGLSKKVKIKS